jgi:hypothetical protein
MCGRYLAERDFYTKKVEKHLRAKVLPGQENEDVDISEPRRYAVQEVIDFCRCLMDEEEKLAAAVHKAKSEMDFDLDTAVIANRSRRALAERLKQETGFEPTHTLRRGGGTGYVLDKDGKPTTFSYDIDTVVTIDFDRGKVKSQSQTLFREAEKLSIEIDRAMLAEIVDYEPKFDPNDAMQNVLDDFLASRK